MKGNWISVKDRLPEENGSYLIYGKEVTNGMWYDDEWWVLHENEITYWMPLPNPPIEVDCELEFSVTSHDCTPCKFYGECIKKKFPVSV